MKRNILQPPHPIPYPENWWMQQFYRTPILLYRLGLGKLFGKNILIISTYGRKTGKTHRTPIEYYRYKGKIFVISGFEQEPDWYRNLKSNPHATLQIGEQILYALARHPETDEEWQGVYEYLAHSPVTRILFSGLIEELDQSEVREQIKSWPVFTFDLADDDCPAPLDTDLVWAWPIILLLAAAKVLLLWLLRCKNRCRGH